MRHRQKRLQLNRSTSLYKATIRSMARNLLTHQSIRTTLHKAKAAKPLAEKLISLAKQNTLFAKRQAFKILGDHKLVILLFNEIGPRFINKQGGYTRIILFGSRRGDNAQVAILELTEIKKKEEKKPKKGKEAKPEEAKKEEPAKEKPVGEAKEKEKPETKVSVKEKPPISKKPSRKFLGGLRKIFKKKSDSL